MPRRRASEDEWEDERMLGGQQRNAANARERARMRVLSRAFCRLKTTLPWVPADTKLSKLDTLRLATSYIAHLRALLCLDEDDDVDQANTNVHPLNLTWPFSFQQLPGTGGALAANQNEITSSWNDNQNTSLSSSSSSPSSGRLEDCTNTILNNNKNNVIVHGNYNSGKNDVDNRHCNEPQMQFNNDHNHNLSSRLHSYYNGNHSTGYSDSLLQIG